MIIDDVGLARVLHVLGVVVWIGGVAMVTVVILPAVRAFGDGEERIRLFVAVERRFAWVARAMIVIVGGSGLYMLWKLDLWSRFAEPGFWWMHAMVGVWAIFALMLFVAEPLFLHREIARRAKIDPNGTFTAMQAFHWFLLAASLITIAGAVAGAHGYFLFGS